MVSDNRENNSYYLGAAEVEAQAGGGEARSVSWDDKRRGLPQECALSFMRVDLMDNGRRQGKAQWAAKLAFSTEGTDSIDCHHLTARYVDFTTPTFFKRTMLNHYVGDLAVHLEDDRVWYEERRKLARDLAKEDGIEKVLIGHAQFRWRAGNGASKLYRYRKQIALLTFFADGRKEICIVNDDTSFMPTHKVCRQRRNRKLNKQSQPNAATDVYYFDPNGYFEKRVRRRRQPPASSTGNVLATNIRAPRESDAGQSDQGDEHDLGQHGTREGRDPALQDARLAEGARGELLHIRSSGCDARPHVVGTLADAERAQSRTSKIATDDALEHYAAEIRKQQSIKVMGSEFDVMARLQGGRSG